MWGKRARVLVAALLLAAGLGTRVATPSPADAAINCNVYVCATLTITLYGEGGGRFVTADGLIDCRRLDGVTTHICTHMYYKPPPASWSIGYTATAVPGSAACREHTCLDETWPGLINFSTNRTFEFGFYLDQVLTVAKAGTGSGKVVSTSTSDIVCGGTCSAILTKYSSVSLQAIPVSGSVFGGWSPPCASTTGLCTFMIDGPTTVTATFNNPSVTPIPTTAPSAPPTVAPSAVPTAAPTAAPTKAAGATPVPVESPASKPSPAVQSTANPNAIGSPLAGSAAPPSPPGPVAVASAGGTDTPLTPGVVSGPTGAVDLTPIALAIVVAAVVLGAAIAFGAVLLRRRDRAI